MAQKRNEPSIQSPRGEWPARTSSGWLLLEREKVEDGFGFEALVAELSARFINLTANQLDDGIEEAQRQICEHFHLDRSALFQRSEGDPENLLLTHLFQRPGTQLPPIQRRPEATGSRNTIYILTGPALQRFYVQVEVSSFFPWIYQQLRRRQTVIIPDVEALPPEAALDQKRLLEYGTKSSVIVPLFSGDDWLGCLTFSALLEPRDWRAAVVKGFEFLANVFTSTLARKRAEQQLRESEQRFRTLIENAGDGVELLDQTARYLDVNAAALNQLGYTREEMIGLRLFDIDPLVTPEHFAQNFESLSQGNALRVESVYRRKDGSTFPVEVTISKIQLKGRCSLLTLVRDITERKLAENALTCSYAEIEQLKDRLQAESDYLKSEFKLSQGHGPIIGRSKGIKQVLHLVEQVAPADCSVLITGETGTGKELIAQEIHRMSVRKEHVMVLVNCAALPSALVESELFGRERGAYTGALTSQVGRFQIANGSSIFLDEVGELSLEVQAKLLRVLQEGEFQRLGNPKICKVDVRVIAATNRDLADEVRKGRFRQDLYYRLKVFPIHIPPLRDRVEDIPLMAFVFLEEFCGRMGKKITKVTRKAMEALQNHSWHGNVRELRNAIEHSVIVTQGDTLKPTILGEPSTRVSQPVTLAEAEREHILKTLQSTGWRIKGPHGAAARLELQPSTLYSRMQKLGIPHRRQRDEMATKD
jgi:PAS domain S-box-containing protein